MTGTSEEELGRLWVRPTTSPVGSLAVFHVEVGRWEEAEGFARRVRGLVAAGVEISRHGGFELDQLPEDVLPAWARGGDFSEVHRDARLRYSLHRGEEEWTAQDLLFSFEPKQRRWKWWDVTLLGGNLLQVWVDSLGEPVFACDELRWILYLSGAHAVVGPSLLSPDLWGQERSAGIDVGSASSG